MLHPALRTAAISLVVALGSCLPIVSADAEGLRESEIGATVWLAREVPPLSGPAVGVLRRPELVGLSGLRCELPPLRRAQPLIVGIGNAASDVGVHGRSRDWASPESRRLHSFFCVWVV
jgi:hypothetical protein